MFKTIIVGGIDKFQLIEELKSHNVHFNEYAQIIFDSQHFNIDHEVSEVSLVKMSIQALGFEDPCYYSVFIKKANELGLQECPMSVAAFLRLEHMDQEEGPYLHVASKNPQDIVPNGLYLRNFEGKIWLRGYRADDDYPHPTDREFIFLQNRSILSDTIKQN